MLSREQEVCEYLNRLARSVGRVFGTDLGVDESGDRLIFVDVDSDPITNDGEEIVAATADEIRDGTHLVDFFVRAGRAAVALKYHEIERSRTP